MQNPTGLGETGRGIGREGEITWGGVRAAPGASSAYSVSVISRLAVTAEDRACPGDRLSNRLSMALSA